MKQLVTREKTIPTLSKVADAAAKSFSSGRKPLRAYSPCLPANTSFNLVDRVEIEKRAYLAFVTNCIVPTGLKNCNPYPWVNVQSANHFSLNLKSIGSIIAPRKGYFILVNAFLTLQNTPAFPQQGTLLRSNLITSTNPVHSILSSKTPLNAPFQTSERIFYRSAAALIFDDCGQGASADNPPATPSTEPGGAEVSENTKVLNPELAWDASESTYSTIYMDRQQKGVELAQYILFNGTGASTDQVRLKMSLTGDLLNDNDYTVTLQGFLGTTAVGLPKEITTGLTNDQYQYYITPGAPFDRIKINILTNQNGNKKAQINVHYVTLIAPPPVFPGSTTINGQTVSSATQCEGSVNLSITNPDPNYVYKWYDSAKTYITAGTSYSPPLADGTYVFYVEAARGSACPSSVQHKINLTVYPKPDTPAINVTN